MLIQRSLRDWNHDEHRPLRNGEAIVTNSFNFARIYDRLAEIDVFLNIFGEIHGMNLQSVFKPKRNRSTIKVEKEAIRICEGSNFRAFTVFEPWRSSNSRGDRFQLNEYVPCYWNSVMIEWKSRLGSSCLSSLFSPYIMCVCVWLFWIWYFLHKNYHGICGLLHP